jgi:hypothetical protein
MARATGNGRWAINLLPDGVENNRQLVLDGREARPTL